MMDSDVFLLRVGLIPEANDIMLISGYHLNKKSNKYVVFNCCQAQGQGKLLRKVY